MSDFDWNKGGTDLTYSFDILGPYSRVREHPVVTQRMASKTARGGRGPFPQ